MAQIIPFQLHSAVTPDLALAAVACREEIEEDYASDRIINQVDMIRTSPAFNQEWKDMRRTGKIHKNDVLWLAARMYAAGQEAVHISREMLAEEISSSAD
jgi:hypothetical protein